TSGAQTISYTITDAVSGCSSTTTQNININPTPTASFTSNAPQCAGNAVNFTNTGTTGGGISYNWDFGLGATPASASTASPKGILYSSAGTKLITFTVNNGTCSAVDTFSIAIDSSTVASFISNAPQCLGSAVNFTNTGSATSDVTYSWNFGPNATPLTSAVQSPAGVTFSTSGSQTISLTVTNTVTACSSTTMQTININPAPVATFTSNAPQCAGNSVNFTNTGTTGAGVTYSWDFGLNATPATSNAANPAGIVYSTAGTKKITFTIDNGSCATVDTMSIAIDSTTVASFTSNAPRCTGDSVNFINTGSSTSDITYSWNFGPSAVPATSTVQNPSGIIFSTSGAQTIMLKVTNTVTGCSSTTTQTININQTPTAKFTSTAPQCAGNAVNFTNTGTTGVGVNYSWDFGMGAMPNISTAENPLGITYPAGGMKLVTLIVNDGVCSAVDTMSIVINALPVAEAGNDTSICATDSAQLGVASVAGYTYSWSPAVGLSNPTIANPKAHPAASSTMYIVTVLSPSGCISRDTVTVNILSPLTANVVPTASICRHDSIQIGSSAVAGEKYAWSPKKGLNDSTLAQPNASPDSTTVYTLTISNGLGCTPATAKVTVTINQLPAVNAGPNDTIGVGASVQLNATGGVEYVWTPTTGLSNANVFNPLASPDTSTTYIVKATDVFGCSNSDTMKVFVVAGNTVWAPSAFTPNGDGKDDIFYIHGNNISHFEMGVYNRWGEQIFYTQDINQGWDGRRQVTREEEPNGAYVYYVRGTSPTGQSISINGMVNLIR
ncbi:MAG TPA: PKD domain-containing protein, partial [Bacteroidia bacterium]|nr:PKD domain-containing protein [Bacteroidia bacterium]